LWPARLSGGLAIGQGLAIMGLIWFLISQTEFQTNTSSESLAFYLFDIVFFGLSLGIPAILAALSGIGMLYYRRAAWLLALLVQGLLLAGSLNF